MSFAASAHAAWAWRLGARVLAAALTFSAAASIGRATEPAMPPGYCAAPMSAEARARPEGEGLPWGAFSISDVGRSVQTAVFVDCFELKEWRQGDRARFSLYGAVTLYQGAELVAESFPTLAALVEPSVSVPPSPRDEADVAPVRYAAPAEALAPRGLIQERIDDGMLFRTRLLEKGAALPQEPAAEAEGGGAVTRAERLTLHLSGAALSTDGAAAIERTIVMPYRGDDSLRYLQASLLAGVSADRLTLLNLP